MSASHLPHPERACRPTHPERSRGALLAALLPALLLACEAPPVSPGADKRQNALAGRIEGRVVVQSAARGDAVVLLYDAARPPPPAGTGHPVAFTVVPKDELFAHAEPGQAGPFTAPFAFSLVAPGRYLVRGFIDANADFIPWYGVTADVNLGDVGGGAVDPVTRAARVIEVGLEGETPVPALDVAVSFSDAARVPVDRPVFEVQGGITSAMVGAPATVLKLSAHALSSGVVHEATPAFLVRLVDDDGDGAPDDANGDGVPDLWPRVVVRKLSDTAQSPVVDENDLDKNGVIDATGQDYAHVDPSSGNRLEPDGAPDAVILAAGFDPTSLMSQLLDAQGKVKTTPTPVSELTLVVKPRALDVSALPKVGVLAQVPAGRWAITLIQSTGQTWRVPNELSPGVAETLGLPAVTSQGFVLQTP